MKRTQLPALLFLAAARIAVAQDPSDAIYDENQIRTFRLNMSANDWNAIANGDGETWRRAEFQWEGESVTGVGVKASGHGTLTARQKQSIRISFNEFEFDAQGRRWRGINRIKLDSMEGNLDKSMMRDRMAFWLLRSAGNPAPRLAHCHLHVNGAYKGVYIAAEPVRKDFARYRWGADDDGNLFEQDGHGSAAYDWRGTNPGSYVPAWFNEENATAPVNYSDLVELINIVNNAQGQDRLTRLNNHINYPGFMRHLACTTVYGDGDDIAHWGGGWCNNHFWYHHEGGKMEIIKWDPDASQGRFYPNADQPLGYQWGQSDMVDWIPGDPTAWNDYKAAIAAVLNGPGNSALSRIDSIYNQIRSAVYADPLKGFSNAEFDTARNDLKDWWTRRMNFLRTQVQTSLTDNALYVSQTAPPAVMTAGQQVSVTVRFRNTGTTTWTPGAGYRLTSRNPTGNVTWGFSTVALAGGDSIAPNQEKAFTFTITAPTAAGTYNFQWSLLKDSTGGFGATSPNVAVVVSVPTTTPADDAVFVSQTVPATMTAGQSYPVTVTFRNTGTATWTAAAGYSLGSRNPTGNTTWGLAGVALAGGDSIAPNQQKSFTFTVTAPTTPGTYNFQWSMRKATTSFGATSTNVAVNVTSAGPAVPEFDAEFVSQSVPPAMVAGQTYAVSVVMRNTGTQSWQQSQDHRLGAQNPENNPAWGATRIDLAAGATVATGQTATFSWTVTAPAAGTYNFQWQMRASLVDLWFGDLTPNVAVTVTTGTTTPPPAGTNTAEFVSQTVQTIMTSGQSYAVTLIFRNSGTTTWTQATGYRLSSRGPRDNTTWGLSRVALPAGASIAPGQIHTFSFNVIAPAAGTHTFQWSMIQEGVDWFDAVSPGISVSVGAASGGGGGGGGGGALPVPTVQGDSGDGVDEKCWGSIGGGTPFSSPLLTGLLALLAASLLSRTKRFGS